MVLHQRQEKRLSNEKLIRLELKRDQGEWGKQSNFIKSDRWNGCEDPMGGRSRRTRKPTVPARQESWKKKSNQASEGDAKIVKKRLATVWRQNLLCGRWKA